MQQNSIQSIVENLWWVIPDRLAGVRQPLPAELSELQSTEIGAIVSVLDTDTNLALYRSQEIPYLWLPVVGGMAPDREQVRAFQVFVDEQNQLDRAVAVHCTGGRHRTGTMLAAYLIATGWSYSAAIEKILHANPEAELETVQKIFLRSLADSVS
jgi:atypical dual specificity phosphatase